MPINGGKYQQTIASLWISHMFDMVLWVRSWWHTSHLPSSPISARSRFSHGSSYIMALLQFDVTCSSIPTCKLFIHTHTHTIIFSQFHIQNQHSCTWPLTLTRHPFAHLNFSLLRSSIAALWFNANSQMEYPVASEPHIQPNTAANGLSVKMAEVVELKISEVVEVDRAHGGWVILKVVKDRPRMLHRSPLLRRSDI